MLLLENWAKKYLLHNMLNERLLGAARKATSQKFVRPTIKRVASLGLLDNLLKTHHLAGGNDPRLLTRKDLRDMGANTANTMVKAKKDNKAVDKSPPCWQYIRAKESERKHRLPFQEMIAKRRRYVEKWNQMSPEAQSTYLAVPSGVSPQQEIVDEDAEYRQKIGNDLWGTSNRKHPIRADVAARHRLKHAVPTPPSASQTHAVPSTRSRCTVPLSRVLFLSGFHLERCVSTSRKTCWGERPCLVDASIVLVFEPGYTIRLSALRTDFVKKQFIKDEGQLFKLESQRLAADCECVIAGFG